VTVRQRRELEEAGQARLRAMLEEKLPQVRARLEKMALSSNRRQAVQARELLRRLDDEFGLGESRGPQ
jgi:hypothetical protein